MRLFDFHTSKARYELMVLLYLWRVNVNTIRGFINIPLADLSHRNLRHNNITVLVGRQRQLS
jgi:hypothetical protein